jgi:hypothetical protein
LQNKSQLHNKNTTPKKKEWFDINQNLIIILRTLL